MKDFLHEIGLFSDDLLLMTTPPAFQSTDVATPAVAPGAVISGPSPDQELDKIFACSPQTSEQDSAVSVPLIQIFLKFQISLSD